MKYPTGVKRTGNNQSNHNSNSNDKAKTDYSARGMTLEKDLDHTNTHYLNTNRAIIHKKPTPIQIVHVDYPARNRAKIDEAYFKVPSTSDFNGIYRGKYIDFEAKETRNKTRFPMINIHDHQVEHMHSCEEHGGVVFLIIRFTSYNETFVYPFTEFYKYWLAFKADGRKSIPYQDIKEASITVPFQLNPRVDYLTAVDELFFT